MLVWAAADAPVTMAEEEGWFAWSYGHRKPRKAFRYRHGRQAPAAFLTLVVPYRGTKRPHVGAALPAGLQVGAARVELAVEASGTRWQIGRELEPEAKAWATPASR